VGHAMQHREPSTFDIWSGNVVRDRRPQQSASLWNFLKSDRDEVLVVREPLAIAHAPLCWSPQRWWQALGWDGPAA